MTAGNGLDIREKVEAIDGRLERLEIDVMAELGHVRETLHDHDVLITDALNRGLPPMRPPADSTSTEIAAIQKSIAPKRQELARKLETEVNPETIERDLEGFGRTLLRSYMWSRSSLKIAGRLALAALVAAHLAWDVIKTHWH